MKKNRIIHWSFVAFIVVLSMACNLSSASPSVNQSPADTQPVEIQPSPVIEASLEPSIEPSLEPPLEPTTAPRRPTAPKIESSVIEGLCAPGSGTLYDCDVQVSDEGIIQVKLQLNGQDAGKDDGIDSVSFNVVTGDGTEVFSTTENNAPYCIFGDSNGECNSWLIEDDIYKWRSDIPLQQGHYEVSIQVNLRDDPLGIFWKGNYDVSFP